MVDLVPNCESCPFVEALMVNATKKKVLIGKTKAHGCYRKIIGTAKFFCQKII